MFWRYIRCNNQITLVSNHFVNYTVIVSYAGFVVHNYKHVGFMILVSRCVSDDEALYQNGSDQHCCQRRHFCLRIRPQGKVLYDGLEGVFFVVVYDLTH